MVNLNGKLGPALGAPRFQHPAPAGSAGTLYKPMGFTALSFFWLIGNTHIIL
jgi:hypothetical protein